ncbi:hypothetical protein VSQ48_07255 [Candidatus Ventrimonas sp. KK005]
MEIYKKNIEGRVYESGLMELVPEDIPNVDVIAIDLIQVLLFKRDRQDKSQYNEEVLKKVKDIIKWKNPQIFFLVMQKKINKVFDWMDIFKEIRHAGYEISLKILNSREITGIPVTEEQLYVIGSRMPDYPYEFPVHMDGKETIPIREFISGVEEDSWYYRINKDQIVESSKEDRFLCWRKDKYIECPCVGWNLIKKPLVRVNGIIHTLTHKEMAGLKGFPRNFDLNRSNKEWLYRMLVYAPNVQLVKRVADNLAQTPLRKLQISNSQKFDQILKSYLQQKGGEIKRTAENNIELDFVYVYRDSTVYFALKFYSSDFTIKQNLYKTCKRLSERRENAGCIVVAVANIVPAEVKEVCKFKYAIHIWDVKNLLWLFEDFIKIKNEFIAFLNYSTEIVEPEKPELYIFDEIEKESEDGSLKEKLLQIKAGTEQWRQYEEICIEILKYILGDYLTLWYEQENTVNGMYRFDLCCKIKDGANQDFFNTIQQYFNTKYIIFEFKNSSEKITQKEIYTTEKYLYEKALRRVAIIVSRKGADENALAAIRGSLRETGKLILCLSDKDILELIDMKQQNEQPTGAFLGAMLDDLLIHLEK